MKFIKTKMGSYINTEAISHIYLHHVFESKGVGVRVVLISGGQHRDEFSVKEFDGNDSSSARIYMELLLASIGAEVINLGEKDDKEEE